MLTNISAQGVITGFYGIALFIFMMIAHTILFDLLLCGLAVIATANSNSEAMRHWEYLKLEVLPLLGQIIVYFSECSGYVAANQVYILHHPSLNLASWFVVKLL